MIKCADEKRLQSMNHESAEHLHEMKHEMQSDIQEKINNAICDDVAENLGKSSFCYSQPNPRPKILSLVSSLASYFRSSLTLTLTLFGWLSQKELLPKSHYQLF